jgi:hypothetical protein
MDKRKEIKKKKPHGHPLGPTTEGTKVKDQMRASCATFTKELLLPP